MLLTSNFILQTVRDVLMYTNAADFQFYFNTFVLQPDHQVGLLFFC